MNPRCDIIQLSGETLSVFLRRVATYKLHNTLEFCHQSPDIIDGNTLCLPRQGVSAADSVGVLLFPTTKSETPRRANGETPLTKPIMEVIDMANKQYSSIPRDVPNLSENVSSTPSHEFVNSIIGTTPPEARHRLATRTRKALASVDLRPAQSLHEGWSEYGPEDLRADIVQALPYIDADDLFSLACLAFRFALCPPGDVH